MSIKYRYFLFQHLAVEIGAADASRSGAALGACAQIGPVVTLFVVAGAAATAICADLGAPIIREELDALRVMGVDPVQALVVPRVRVATLVALLLSPAAISSRIVQNFVVPRLLC
jgi:phospholipid/cholesterol/gamma-HCH transport system permease protein